MEVKLLTSPESLRDMENFAALAALTCHANTEKKLVPHEILARIIKLGAQAYFAECRKHKTHAT